MLTQGFIAGGAVAQLDDGAPPTELFFLRASNLKMMRLQLALERQDRRAALMAVDELLDLDRAIERHLALVSEPFLTCQPGHGLDLDRAAVDQEKLALAAQIINRNPSWARTQGSHQHPTASSGAACEEPALDLGRHEVSINDGPGIWQEEEQAAVRRWPARAVLTALLTLLACASVFAAYLLGYIGPTSPSLL